MIRYQTIAMGPACPGACAGCTGHAEAPRPLDAIVADIQSRPDRRNLFLAGGDASAHPELLPLLRYLLTQDIRRLKIKCTGPALLDARLRLDVLSLGAMIFDLDCLGHEARVHDTITGKPGSFETLVKTLKVMRNTLLAEHPVNRPVLLVTVPVCERNAGHLIETTRLLIRHGVDRIIFRNLGRVSLSKLCFDLQTACRMAVMEEIWPSFQGFPFCVLAGLEYFSQDLYDPDSAWPTTPACSGCLFEACCPHVPASYLETFGPSEIVALPWHRDAESLLRIARHATA